MSNPHLIPTPRWVYTRGVVQDQRSQYLIVSNPNPGGGGGGGGGGGVGVSIDRCIKSLSPWCEVEFILSSSYSS